jgi:hypothetical protein
MMKLILGLIGFVLAVLGVLAKTTHEEGKGILKRPTAAGWVVLVLLLFSLGLSLVLEAREFRHGQVQAAKEELWQTADARMKLLAQDVKEPICSFVSMLKEPQPLDQAADLNALFFGSAVESGRDVIGNFDLTCSPGGDWKIVGMFTRDTATKPCFSSNRGICNAGVLLWGARKSEATSVKIVDKWDEAINAARWMAGYSKGKEVARLTFNRPLGTDKSKLNPGARWLTLFGDAELLFAVITEAGLWLRVPLQRGEIEQDSTEIRLRWFVADAPKIGLVL